MGPTAAYVSKNIFFKLFKKQINNIYPKLKIEDDNPRQFDQVFYRSVNVKNASLIGPELQCLSSLVSYILQEVLDTTNSTSHILYGHFGSLGHARLTAIKSASGLDKIQI